MYFELPTPASQVRGLDDRGARRGISFGSVHSKMPCESGLRKQKQWQAGKVHVIVATIAFGMVWPAYRCLVLLTGLRRELTNVSIYGEWAAGLG